MKLVHIESQVDVKVGDTVKDSDGVSYKLVGWRKPHTSASTGRVYLVEIDNDEIQYEYFPSVVNCEWIDREDRA